VPTLFEISKPFGRWFSNGRKERKKKIFVPSMENFKLGLVQKPGGIFIEERLNTRRILMRRGAGGRRKVR